jgi:hypothetical protein
MPLGCVEDSLRAPLMRHQSFAGISIILFCDAGFGTPYPSGPSGIPGLCQWLNDASSDGLMTHVHPAATAGASLLHSRTKGAFPRRDNCDHANRLAPCILMRVERRTITIDCSHRSSEAVSVVAATTVCSAPELLAGSKYFIMIPVIMTGDFPY